MRHETGQREFERRELHLHDTEYIDSLVRDQRIPRLLHGWQGITRDTMQRTCHVIVPPSGSQLDDKVEGTPGFGYKFRSQEGQDRGNADFIRFNGNEKSVKKLKTDINTAVKKYYPHLIPPKTLVQQISDFVEGLFEY